MCTTFPECIASSAYLVVCLEWGSWFSLIWNVKMLHINFVHSWHIYCLIVVDTVQWLALNLRLHITNQWTFNAVRWPQLIHHCLWRPMKIATTTSIWWLRWRLVCIHGPQLPVKSKGLSSKEGVKLFFICCKGLGDLLLFMSATVDTWVRGKALLWDVT